MAACNDGSTDTTISDFVTEIYSLGTCKLGILGYHKVEGLLDELGRHGLSTLIINVKVVKTLSCNWFLVCVLLQSIAFIVGISRVMIRVILSLLLHRPTHHLFNRGRNACLLFNRFLDFDHLANKSLVSSCNDAKLSSFINDNTTAANEWLDELLNTSSIKYCFCISIQ